MFDCFQSECNRIPLETLPIAFKKRLAKLAYVPDLKNLRKTCPEMKYLCRDGAREFEQLYFTDNDDHFQKAKFFLLFFRIFKYIYIWLRFVFDEAFSFYGIWQNVYHLQDVKRNKTKFYVNDTLVVYCAAIESYDQLIPYICGPYTRISIRGHIRWDQVKRLIHPKVREIQIRAKIEFRPDEYREFVQFIDRHLCGFQYKFMFKFYTDYPMMLVFRIQQVLKHKWVIFSWYCEGRCYFFDYRVTLLQGASFSVLLACWTFAFDPIIPYLKTSILIPYGTLMFLVHFFYFFARFSSRV